MEDIPVSLDDLKDTAHRGIADTFISVAQNSTERTEGATPTMLGTPLSFFDIFGPSCPNFHAGLYHV